MLCKNCKTTLEDNINFCNHCGAKVIRNRLTLKALLFDFYERFLNYDNKFLQTFLTLFSKPEHVIDGYINGTRKKYVDAISFFAIAITFAGLQVFVLRKFFPDSITLSGFTTNGTEAFSKTVLNTIQEYISFVMIFSIPIYALMAKVVFFNKKKYNYTELVVLFMYTVSQLTIIGMFIAIPAAALNFSYGDVGMVFLPIQILYQTYCLKRAYALNAKNLFLKVLLFLFVLAVFYITFIILFTLGLIMYYGGLQEFSKAMKQA